MDLLEEKSKSPLFPGACRTWLHINDSYFNFRRHRFYQKKNNSTTRQLSELTDMVFGDNSLTTLLKTVSQLLILLIELQSHMTCN